MTLRLAFLAARVSLQVARRPEARPRRLGAPDRNGERKGIGTLTSTWSCRTNWFISTITERTLSPNLGLPLIVTRMWSLIPRSKRYCSTSKKMWTMTMLPRFWLRTTRKIFCKIYSTRTLDGRILRSKIWKKSKIRIRAMMGISLKNNLNTRCL